MDVHGKCLFFYSAAIAGGQMVFPFLDVRESSHDPTAHLTAREKTLLEELATGKTNKQLAAQFTISVNTVKFHLSNLFDKLNVHNRSEAVAFYYASKFDEGSASRSDLDALEGYAKK
ncbi:MAG: response regulator transcription factor [Hyphomicrobiales bacterium]